MNILNGKGYFSMFNCTGTAKEMLGTNSRGTPIHLNKTKDVCTNGTPVHSKDCYLTRGSLCIMHLGYFQSKLGQSDEGNQTSQPLSKATNEKSVYAASVKREKKC